MATDRLINSTQGDSIITKLDDIKTAINNQSTAATATPLMDGTATVGTSTKYARENHVHPTDTSRAANVMSTYAIDTARENITTSSTVQGAIEQLEYREELNKNNILTLSAELAKYVIAQKTLKLNPTGAGETPDVTMSQTGSSDGWWISNGVSISGISRILSICITGFGSIRETDVITPCTTNDRTQLRIATNVGTFKANATLTVQVFGLSS